MLMLREMHRTMVEPGSWNLLKLHETAWPHVVSCFGATDKRVYVIFSLARS